MPDTLKWSDKLPIKNRRGVPTGAGIYLIGEHDPSLCDSWNISGYWGANFPSEFRARYVGMTMSLKYGLATRLRSHARGKGNFQIQEYLKQNGPDNLFYVYSTHSEADLAESIFLRHRRDDFFNWNNKEEREGWVNRFSIEHGPPDPFYSDHLELSEQLQEVEEKREIFANWNQVLADNPKYSSMAEKRRNIS